MIQGPAKEAFEDATFPGRELEALLAANTEVQARLAQGTNVNIRQAR